MGKEIGKGYSRDAQTSERIGLDLDIEDASSLYLILKYFIVDYDNRLQRIEEDTDLSEETRKDAKEIESQLLEDAKNIAEEVGEILVELDKPKKLIFTKPSWKQDQ